MEEVGKIRKIFKGFFPDETVSDRVKEERRSICGSCQYNSANTASGNLSPIDYMRSKLTGPPFCTLCKCQIFEKTQSPLEECAAYMANESKKWFKTRLETMGNNDLNITNVSDTKVDLQLEHGRYKINYGQIDRNSVTEIELLVDINSSDTFKIFSVHPSCGCTATKFTTVNNQGILNLRIDLNFLGLGAFSKSVDIEYLINNIPHRATILLTGFKI